MFSIMCGLALAQDTPSEATWEATLESVVPGVVALRVVVARVVRRRFGAAGDAERRR